MKNALEKTREVNKRAPEFYKIVWIEEEEVEDDYDAEIKKQQVDVVEECGETRFQAEPHKADPAGTNGRKKWKIQHFSEFKNDKVKREQVRKFIKSKDLMIPAEKLVMKPLVARKNRLVELKERKVDDSKEKDDNNNVNQAAVSNSFLDDISDAIEEMKSLKLDECNNQSKKKKKVRFAESIKPMV